MSKLKGIYTDIDKIRRMVFAELAKLAFKDAECEEFDKITNELTQLVDIIDKGMDIEDLASKKENEDDNLDSNIKMPEHKTKDGYMNIKEVYNKYTKKDIESIPTTFNDKVALLIYPIKDTIDKDDKINGIMDALFCNIRILDLKNMIYYKG